jgi:hypothetical protein
MSKEIKASELNKTASRLEKEAEERIETATAMRLFADVQTTKESLDSAVKSLKDKRERDIKHFNEGREKLESIELTVASEEEKMEARVASIRSDGEKQAKEVRAKVKEEIEGIQEATKVREQEAQVKIAGYKNVEEKAEKGAANAVAKKEQAESAYQDFKTKMLV